MAVHKLQLDDLYDYDYDLIAIHSLLEDYRLAYFLNQSLPILLSKSKDSIEITTKDGEAFFSKFIFEDKANHIQWSLIQNKNEIVTSGSGNDQDLFLNTNFEIETSVFLIPEYKKVDYFLKIENNHDTFNIDEIIKKINTIERISTVYSIDPDKIKSKNNLIF
jgi:hypothetical protein